MDAAASYPSAPTPGESSAVRFLVAEHNATLTALRHEVATLREQNRGEPCRLHVPQCNQCALVAGPLVPASVQPQIRREWKRIRSRRSKRCGPWIVNPHHAHMPPPVGYTRTDLLWRQSVTTSQQQNDAADAVARLRDQLQSERRRSSELADHLLAAEARCEALEREAHLHDGIVASMAQTLEQLKVGQRESQAGRAQPKSARLRHHTRPSPPPASATAGDGPRHGASSESPSRTLPETPQRSPRGRILRASMPKSPGARVRLFRRHSTSGTSAGGSAAIVTTTPMPAGIETDGLARSLPAVGHHHGAAREEQVPESLGTRLVAGESLRARHRRMLMPPICTSNSATVGSTPAGGSGRDAVGAGDKLAPRLSVAGLDGTSAEWEAPPRTDTVAPSL